MRQVFTLKYRPQTFAELLIQDHVRDTLIRAIERNRLANAYLFAGPRGVGKTTTARILSKSLNCLSYDKPTTTPCNSCSVCGEITESRNMDVLEIDGASNRGIDQVRELREGIKYAPVQCRYKVYIIDEVHMLTTEAFNALLKTLEEPPPHAKFIFATTAVHKVPLTIISRCQRFDFRKATPAEIIQRLTWIAEKEGIKISPKALAAIARFANGAIRDAEGLLDQLATYSPEGIELAQVEELLGLVPANLFFEYTQLIAEGNAKELIEFIDRLFSAGYDFMEFYSGAVAHFRNLLFFKLGGEDQEAGLSPEEIAELKKQTEWFDVKRLLNILSTLSKNEAAAKHSLLPRVLLELVSLELIEEYQAESGPLTTRIGGLNPREVNSPDHPNRGSQPDAQTRIESPGEGRSDLPPTADHQERIADCGERRADAGATAIFSRLRAALYTKNSAVARFLEFALPVSWEDNTLTVAFAQQHKGLILQLEKKRHLIEATLQEITEINSRFNAIVEMGQPPDADRRSATRRRPPPSVGNSTIEKLQKYFDEIEER